jgi:SAM-dependent methyltransferase
MAVERIAIEGIEGWATGIGETAAALKLALNGVEIAETSAGRLIQFDGEQKNMGFKFRVDSLWSYLGAGDRLEVLQDGAPLSIVGHGFTYIHQSDDQSRASELLEKIQNGYVFDKRGKLIPSLRASADWQREIFELFDELRRHFRQYNYELMVTYGTLLGAIREQNFIKQDDDFDVTYISRYSSPGDVTTEACTIIQRLMDAGYVVEINKRRNVIKVKKRRGAPSIDIFYSWFAEDGTYQICYGHHGPAVARSPLFSEMMSARLGEYEIQVPKNSEELLQQFFGVTWRIPDQGFSHKVATRVIDREYFIPPKDAECIYWAQFYREHDQLEPSPFARFVLPYIPSSSLVVDVGCGNGKDAIFFALEGFDVVGFDRSPEGIEHALARRDQQLLKRVSFEVIDAARSDLSEVLRTIIRKRRPLGGTVVMYLRFFLHAIPKTTENNLFDAISTVTTKGSIVAAEFRTTLDIDQPKAFRKNIKRRYLSPAVIAKKLKARGFSMLLREEGHGFSVFNGEDPHLCRIIATKSEAK